jgi:hypothetical protein
MNPLEGGQRVSSITGTSSSTVQNILHWKVDFSSNRFSRDFYSVCQGGQGCVSPARSTVLRDVLIQHFCQVRTPVYVVPVPRQRQSTHICVHVRLNTLFI